MNDNPSEDLDWLYRRKASEVDQTRIFTPEEMARMNPAGSAATPPQHHQYQQTPPPPPLPAAPRKSRRRRKRRPVLRTISLLLALWLLFMVGTPIYAWVSGTVVDAASSGTPLPDQPGTAILLVGSDAREDLTPEERSRLGTGSTEGRRTDTMMLLYKPPTGRTALVSLPRDSLVDIPGRKRNKLNAAYAFGGAPLLVETVELNTGIQIDGYMEIGLLGLVEVVDALGGIEVCLDAPIQDRDSHLDLPAGCQELDGVTALGYVRMRKADARGDLGRVERQREVIGKIAGKAANPLNFLNPVTYWKLNMAVSKSVGRDEGMGVGGLFSVATGFFSAGLGSGISLTVPIANANASTDVGSAVIWDEAASNEVFEAIRSGDTAVLEKYER